MIAASSFVGVLCGLRVACTIRNGVGLSGEGLLALAVGLFVALPVLIVSVFQSAREAHARRHGHPRPRDR
jgi:hypothetical protein